MYVDKLDGRVTNEFFEQKSAEWRQEQAAVRQNLEQHEQANQSYLQEGVAILVHPRGFEPLTFGSVDRCSIQLS